jgi:hypothetical protein
MKLKIPRSWRLPEGDELRTLWTHYAELRWLNVQLQETIPWSSARARCTATRWLGRVQCRTPALPDSELCWEHDEDETWKRPGFTSPRAVLDAVTERSDAIAQFVASLDDDELQSGS